MQTENDEPKKEEPKETTTEQSWDDYPDDCDDEDYERSMQEDDEDEFQEAMDNCGQVPGGGCMLVGTEYCDFECPFAKSMWANMQKKRDAKGRYTK